MAFDFNKIKGLFVETSAEATSKEAEKPAQSSGSRANQPVSAKASAEPYDQKILNSLLKVIEDHNLPGEDYLEFLSAFQAMKDIPLDEKMKIQTVLATLSTKGLTPKKIKESADYYKKVLAEEQKQFYAELGNQTNNQVKSREKEIAKLQLAGKQKSEQIAALTKEINDTQAKINEIQMSMKEAEEKIKSAEVNFNKTYDFVITQIDSNLTKL
jgi:chromosome segregation ATPase